VKSLRFLLLLLSVVLGVTPLWAQSPKPTVVPVVAPGVRVIGGTSSRSLKSARISSVQSDSMTLDSSTAASVHVGDVLIDPRGRGLARKVIGVQGASSDGVIKTRPASLTDIFKQADIRLHKGIGLADVDVASAQLAPGVSLKKNVQRSDRVSAANIGLAGLGFHFQNFQISSGNTSATVNGDVSMSSTLDLQIDIRKFPFPKPLRVRSVLTQSASADCDVEVERSLNIAEVKKLFAVLPGDPIPFTVAGIPVVITPVLAFYTTFEAGLNGKMTLKPKATLSYDAGVEWIDGSGTKLISNLSRSASCDAAFTADGSASFVPLRAEFVFYIYSVKGPYFFFDAPKFKATVQALPNLPWSVTGQFVVGAGFKPDIFGISFADLNIEQSVEGDPWLIASGDLSHPSPTPTPTPTATPQTVASLTLTPATASIYTGNYQTLKPQALDSNGYAISLPANRFTWATSDSSIATVNNGVAQGVAVGTATITATETSSGRTASATLSVGYGPNVVTNTSADGYGSFKAAVDYANVFPNTTISFRIPNNDPNFKDGVFTIYGGGSINADMIIDGASQTNFTGDTNANGPEINIRGYISANDAKFTFKNAIVNWHEGTVSSNSTFNVDQNSVVVWEIG